MLNYERQLRRERQASLETDVADEVIDLPPIISGKVVEMVGGGMNVNGHALECDFLGHLPPAASYTLV